MRSLILLVGVVLFVPTPADAEPAFLGIGLDTSPTMSGCRAISITDESAAAMAGLQIGDSIVTFAGSAIANCASLLTEIANHSPGDEVAVEVTRLAKRAVPLAVTLTSRTDVTQRRMVGRKLEVPMVEIDDHGVLEPIAFDRTTVAVVVSQSCMDCAYVTSQLAYRLRNRSDLRLLAIVPGHASQVIKDRDRRYEAPLAVAESRFIDEMLVTDSRAHVMIVDRDGVVVQIAPVSQDQSMREFIDELVLTTEQADRKGRR